MSLQERGSLNNLNKNVDFQSQGTNGGSNSWEEVEKAVEDLGKSITDFAQEIAAGNENLAEIERLTNELNEITGNSDNH